MKAKSMKNTVNAQYSIVRDKERKKDRVIANQARDDRIATCQNYGHPCAYPVARTISRGGLSACELLAGSVAATVPSSSPSISTEVDKEVH
ncbi:MAG: hypothetical protein EXX96DRAFT_622301 [Benjaminiella poitrasii]|nr:MAG: hypothetical protein EXX96DRAFT_622301 [Benjaminiella poitrasii]